VAGDPAGLSAVGLALLVLAIVAALAGMRPMTLKVVPEPRRMATAYEAAIARANAEEILPATLVATKAEAFVLSTRVDRRKVKLCQVALLLFVVGVLVAAAALAVGDGGSVALIGGGEHRG
jgi:hypothetical protein